MSKSKAPKQPLTPANVQRLLEDSERKGDLKGEGVRRVLAAAIQYGEAMLSGTASELEVEAFWQRLYLVFTEIEDYHRRSNTEAAASLAQTPDHRFLRAFCKTAKVVVKAHDALRKVVSKNDLVLVDLRRHAACHVSVDGNQIRLAKGAIVDRRPFPILGEEVLTVEEQDVLLSQLGTADDASRSIATRSVPILKLLLIAATPLHTPLNGPNNKLHAVQENDGTWAEIAVAAGVELEALLNLNAEEDGAPLAESKPMPGKIIVIPERSLPTQSPPPATTER